MLSQTCRNIPLPVLSAFGCKACVELQLISDTASCESCGDWRGCTPGNSLSRSQRRALLNCLYCRHGSKFFGHQLQHTRLHRPTLSIMQFNPLNHDVQSKWQAPDVKSSQQRVVPLMACGLRRGPLTGPGKWQLTSTLGGVYPDPLTDGLGRNVTVDSGALDGLWRAPGFL